ncbi:YhbY family RNA-binding protein [Fusibacter sp. JL216-2]|uniref:YhbY family RNA-binding protein n=1 Tax=Fusibacter sp. JL216-2 TaxID=3071453 RepID=UPI003D344796
MITAKQRSYLKGIANKKKPLAQLGKDGISEAFLTQMDALLESHELVKVNVLDASLMGSKEAGNKVAKRTKAEFVQAIGNKFVIYRRATEDPKIELPKK